MKGMKKLLSVLGVMILASALLPAPGHALRYGSFDPIGYPSIFINGYDQSALRGTAIDGSGNPTVMFDNSATQGKTEKWLAMTTRSGVAGSETVRELWQFHNVVRAPLAADPATPLLLDPAAVISYADPAWSPDGKWLAYVQTDKLVLSADIYIQQFTVSNNIYTAATPIGSATLVVSGGGTKVNRHPAWDPTGTKLVYDTNLNGSLDLYTVGVLDGTGTPSVGTPTRITFNNAKAEQMPAWSPTGTEVAYVTNLFGPWIIKVLDLSTVPNPTDGALAEVNFAQVSHFNPSWSSVPGERVLYYDAPDAENSEHTPQIWRLDLNTQAKCEIAFGNGSSDPDVSRIVEHDGLSGLNFNYFDYDCSDPSLGQFIMRADYLFNCAPPLPMIVQITPNTWDLKHSASNTDTVAIKCMFPAETQAAGFWCYPANNGSTQGILLRNAFAISPTIMGQPSVDPSTGGVWLADAQPGPPAYTTFFEYNKTLIDEIVALGLVGKQVPIEVGAISLASGRRFSGFGYIKIPKGQLKAGAAVQLVQNSPNPFNPATKITFANRTPGNVELRVFNVRGELVKTLAKQWFPAGVHTVTWDGHTDGGASASSGMYFAQVKAAGAVDNLKMLLMK
jgi:hypothetical protein